MTRMILLTPNNKFSLKANKLGQYFIGICLILIGISNFFSNALGAMAPMLGTVIVVGGLIQLIISYLTYTPTSHFAPRVKLDEKQIELKSGLFSSTLKIKWSEVKKIELGSFVMVFHLADRNEMFAYNTKPTISSKIKEAIRQIANNKNIEVIN